MSEAFDFGTASNKTRVQIGELLSSLKDQKSHANLRKESKRNRQQNKVLPIPLSKLHEEKIKRNIAYENVTEEVSKWDSTVHRNRLAEQITFPLQDSSIKLQTWIKTTEEFAPKTDLEQKIASLLGSSKNVLHDDKVLTEAEEEALKAMDLDEAMRRRQEIQKMRALQSYMEAKAYRQNKIKSKQYHRLLKKDRMKKEKKDFELLLQTDPNAATEKLEKIDRDRIEERMTLKHRGTSRWAKQLQSRAKYDKDARSSLAEQLKINRELVQKVKNDSESEEDVKNEVEIDKNNVEIEESPWLSYKKGDENEGEDEDEKLQSAIEGYKKVWKEVREKFEKQKTVNEKSKPKKAKNEIAKLELEAEELVNKTIRNLKRGLQEDPEEEEIKTAKDEKNKKAKISALEEPVVEDDGKKIRDENIETDFDNVGKEVKSRVSISNATELILNCEEDEDSDVDDEEHRMTLAEAFADDDVTSAFREEKEAAIKKDQPEDINMFLPGWGRWAGAGIKVNEKVEKKFLIDVPKLKRKDETMGNVILNEDKDKKMSKYQVNQVPFPFSNSFYFEKSLQIPLGKNWNSETGFRKLTAPKVVTQLGAIVDPIDKDAISNVQAKIDPKKNINNKKKFNKNKMMK